MSLRTATVAVLAGLAGLARAGTDPKVTPLTLGIEMEIGNVPIAEYDPNCAGCAYAPTEYQLPLLHTKGDSSIQGMPLWLVTVDGNKGHLPGPADQNPAAVADAAYIHKFFDDYEASTFNGVMEIEGGPVDMNDEALMRQQLDNMVRFVSLVKDKFKCTTVQKRFALKKKDRKVVQDDNGGEQMLQLTTTHNPTYERGFPLDVLVDEFNSLPDLPERVQLAPSIPWAVAYDNFVGDFDAEFPNGPFHHEPYYFCRNANTKPPVLPAPQANFVVPLAKFAYAFPATDPVHKPIEGMLGGNTETVHALLLAARAAVHTAAPTLFAGAHDMLWEVPEVRGLMVFAAYTTVMGALHQTNDHLQFLAYKQMALDNGLSDTDATNQARHRIEHAPDAGKNLFQGGMMKTAPGDYPRAFPPKLKAAFSAFLRAHTKDNFVTALYTPLNTELTTRAVNFADKNRDHKYSACPKAQATDVYTRCQTRVRDMLGELYDDMLPGRRNRYRSSEALNTANYGNLDVNANDMPRVRGPVVRTVPLRLKASPHLMVLLEQRQGRVNSAIKSMASGDQTLNVDFVMDTVFRDDLKKFMVPHVPACPAVATNVHDACKGDFVFTHGSNQAKADAKHHIKSHATAHGTHICLVPEAQLVAANPAASAALVDFKHAGWAHYLGLCSVGTVVHVMYQP